MCSPTMEVSNHGERGPEGGDGEKRRGKGGDGEKRRGKGGDGVKRREREEMG